MRRFLVWRGNSDPTVVWADTFRPWLDTLIFTATSEEGEVRNVAMFRTADVAYVAASLT